MALRSWDGVGLEVLERRELEGGRLARQGRFAVCFGAAWCPWTRRIVRKFRGWERESELPIVIADLTDRKSPLWDQFRISITPSVLCFENGEVVLRLDGRRLIGLSHRDLTALQRFVGMKNRPS
jgi:hypothetical protein